MSNNANGPRWNEGEPSPDIVLAGSLGALDAFVSEIVVVDFTPGQDIILDLPTYCSGYNFNIINASAPHGLTFPANKKTSRINNTSGQTITLKLGTTNLNVPNGQAVEIYSDGTANGLALVSSSNAAPTLQTLGDVDDTTPPTNGQVPTFNSSEGKFKFATPSGGGGGGASSTVAALSIDFTAGGNGAFTTNYSKNVASITRIQAAIYQIVFTNPVSKSCIPNAAAAYGGYADNANTGFGYGRNNSRNPPDDTEFLSGITLIMHDQSNNPASYDPATLRFIMTDMSV